MNERSKFWQYSIAIICVSIGLLEAAPKEVFLRWKSDFDFQAGTSCSNFDNIQLQRFVSAKAHSMPPKEVFLQKKSKLTFELACHYWFELTTWTLNLFYPQTTRLGELKAHIEYNYVFVEPFRLGWLKQRHPMLTQWCNAAQSWLTQRGAIHNFVDTTSRDEVISA